MSAEIELKPGRGWGAMPFPVIVPPRHAPAYASDDEISSDYPFEPNFVDILGARMHYIDVGTGDPILLLHGNPTWSYMWRNIIPHLVRYGRCIAPDMVGYGRSSKPDIEYRWRDHRQYLDAFVAKLNLRNITLVLHDQGSSLGFHYAMQRERSIRRIACFESILRPYSWESFSTAQFRTVFRAFRTGGVGGLGWRILVDQNAFIEELLPQGSLRQLSEEEMDYYREPFVAPRSRVPIWQFPRQTPIGGEPVDVWQAASEYSAWLTNTRVPKLLLFANPGALVTAEHLAWATRQLPNLTTVDIGTGSHFLHETCPHMIGREIARWFESLAGDGR
jgi:haloalkane dehalogenase